MRTPRPARLYVVTAPATIRGIYETWEACRAAVSGVAGARYQAVAGRAEAERLLRGEPLVLAPGQYAFVDGNHLGGVGVVLAREGADGAREVQEVGTTVYAVFEGAGIPSLDERRKVTAAVDTLRNIVAELAALFLALGLAPAGSVLTVVHDYEGVGAWLQGRWQARAPVVVDIVAACRTRIADRRLQVRFRHQRGHASTVAGRNDYAAFNARADRLAAEAALGPDHPPRPGGGSRCGSIRT